LIALLDLCQAPTGRRESIAGVLLAVAGPAAVLIRGNGLALAPAIAVALLTTGRSNQRKRAWLVVGLASIFLAYSAWAVWGQYHQFQGIDNVTYLDEVQAVDLSALWRNGGFQAGVPRISTWGFFTRLYQNVAWYQVYNADSLVWPYAGQLADVQLRGVGLALASLALVPALVGSTVMARRFLPLVVWLASSLLLTICYPTGGAPRMLLPSIPVLILVFYAGLEALLGRRMAIGWATCALWANIFLCAVQADFQSRQPYFGEPYFGGESTVNAIALIREDLPRLTTPNDVVISHYYQVIDAVADRRAGPPDSLTRYRVDGSLFVLENPSHVITIPDGLAKQTVAERGDVRLSRLSRSP
jgi:hypothetical protein